MKKVVFALIAVLCVSRLGAEEKNTLYNTPVAPGDPGLFSTVLVCSDAEGKAWYESEEETKEDGLYDTYDGADGKEIYYVGSYTLYGSDREKVLDQGVKLTPNAKKNITCRKYIIMRRE